jgi:hypothetical protein
MKEIIKVAGINIGLILLYAVILWLNTALGVELIILALILLQLAFNIIGGILYLCTGETARGQAMLISGGTIILIGHSMCSGALGNFSNI